MLAKNELAEYIQTHYGQCQMGEGCCCLRVGWNHPCPHWVPVKATNWEELREEMKQFAEVNHERTIG